MSNFIKIRLVVLEVSREDRTDQKATISGRTMLTACATQKHRSVNMEREREREKEREGEERERRYERI